MGGVRFNLDFINSEPIRAIDVNLISKLTGRSVYQERLTELTDSILIPSDDLVTGRRVHADPHRSGRAGHCAQPDGAVGLPLRTFGAQPCGHRSGMAHGRNAVSSSSRSSCRTWKALPSIVSGWSRDQGGAPIRDTEVTVPAGEELRVPVSGVRSGGYVMRVQALDPSDRVLVESAGLKVAYQAPGAIARLVASLQGSTVAVLGVCGLGVVALVGLGALVVFLVPKGKGMRNVELALPEKARRPPRPAEPAAPPAGPVVAPRAAPAPPRPAEPAPPPAATRRRGQGRACPAATGGTRSASRRTRRRAQGQRLPRRDRRNPLRLPPDPSWPPGPRLPRRDRRNRPMPSRRLHPRHLRQRRRSNQPRRPKRPAFWPWSAWRSRSSFNSRPRSESRHSGSGVPPTTTVSSRWIATSAVSGHHCVITFADGRWYVQDDESTFGTTVNGQPVPKGQPFRLEDGAVLGLGPKLKIRFQIVSGSSQGAPS